MFRISILLVNYYKLFNMSPMAWKIMLAKFLEHYSDFQAETYKRTQLSIIWSTKLFIATATEIAHSLFKCDLMQAIFNGEDL